MKLSEALRVINENCGYAVRFHTLGGFPDWFPANNEDPFLTVQEAREKAVPFAEKTAGRFYDVTIINAVTGEAVKDEAVLNPAPEAAVRA
jgi:hypothetical protein